MATTFKLRIPKFTLVASLDLVDHVSETLQVMGFTPQMAAESKKIVLPISGVTMYPTMSKQSISEHQLVMPTEAGQQAFTFEAYEQACVHDLKSANMGGAITLFVNAGPAAEKTTTHHVGCTTYVDILDLYRSAANMLQLKTTLNDTSSTPVTIMVQAALSESDVQWVNANSETLKQLNCNFNTHERIEQRLKGYSQQRLDAFQDYVDPHNKGCLFSALAMPCALVKHVTNCKTMDPQQLEFFQNACYARTPAVCSKAGPLAAALLLSTAVKYATAKHCPTGVLTYKALGDLLEASPMTQADVAAFEHIWNNHVTSVVPAIGNYTSDVAYMVRESGVATLQQVGEEQMILGSNIMQMVQARIDLATSSNACRHFLQEGNHVQAQASFASAHKQRLLASDQDLGCDCEDFTFTMRMMHACLLHPEPLQIVSGLIGTPVLCAECGLQRPGNTIPDAQRTLNLCARILGTVKERSVNKTVNCTCIAAAASFMTKYDMQQATPAEGPRPSRQMFPDRDALLWSTMKMPSGHACRAVIQKTLVGSKPVGSGVTMRVWDVKLQSMEESTSSTIKNLNPLSNDKFDMCIKMGAGNEHVYSGMTQALVGNLSGGVYADLLSGSGLALQHIADRRGTSDFYNVVCQLDGMNLIDAEHRATLQPLPASVTAQKLLAREGDCNFYYSAPFAQCAAQSVTAIDYELHPEEQALLNLLADTQAKLYIKPTNCIETLGREGSCFMPCLSEVSPTILGQETRGDMQHFILTQKTPMLPVLEVVGASSINDLISKQKAHIQKVLGMVNENWQRSVTLDHISTDIVYVHTHNSQAG
jgi:hypothetical protein